VSIVGLLAFGAVAGVALLELVIRRSDVGAAIVLGLIVVYETGLIELAVEIGAVRVQAADLLFVLLLAAATARLLRVERLTTAQRLLIAIGIITLWALARGVGPFGAPAAINEARKFLWFTGVALYFATVESRRDLLDRMVRMWLVTAAVLAGFAMLRWVGNAAGLAGGFFGADADLRVLPADMALLISQAALLSFPYLIERTAGWRRFLAPAFLVLVLLLQHRTVWIVTAAGVLLLFHRERAIARRALVALAAMLMLLSALVFTVFDDPELQLTEQLATSAQSTATFEWRLEGWRSLLVDSGPEDLQEVLVGKPFGGGWARTLPNGRVIDANITPHNFYLESVLRIGVLGLFLLVAVYALALRRTNASRRSWSPEGLLSPTVLFVMIAVQLIYFLTYSPDLAQAMLLGLGAAVSRDAWSARPTRDLVGAGS
jgi:O-antigen ligase